MTAYAFRWFAALAIMLAATLPVVGTPKHAAACSCAGSDLSDQLANATAAFRGTVVAERPFMAVAKEVTFQANEFWLGTPISQVTVYTASHGVSCGADFVAGREYFVLAFGDRALETGLCSFNVDIAFDGPEKLAAVQALGPGTPVGPEVPLQQPGSPDDGGAGPVAIGGVLLASVIAAAAVMIVARRT